MRNFSIAVVALVVLGTFVKPGAADDKSEVAKFQGVWKFDSYVNDGGQLDKKYREKMTIKFEEGNFTQRHDKAFGGAGPWKIDTTKTPMEFTMTYKEGESPGVTLAGIYRWDDDDLVVCWGDKRPTKFESEPGQKQRLIRLSKVKK